MLALAAIAPLSAQQLPNNGFEEDWVDCYPWTSAGNTKTKQGTTPAPWIVSNTIGTGTMGKTTIADKVEGYNSSSAVKISNKSILGNVIPGYFSLGTAWSTATGLNGGNKDGGTFGGYEFTYRPDAVSFFYKASGDAASVVAYTWNGTFKQADVPGNIVLSGDPKVVTMEDRDRNILDMATAQGQGVIQKGSLIASNTARTAVAENWTEFTMELNYVNSETPEKFNVIFSAGDYFNSAPVKDHSMTVDDVKLLYYSRLKTITVNGVEANLEDAVFDEDGHCTYDLSESINMPRSVKAIKWECLGESPAKKVDIIALDAENNTATITVKNTNEGAQDVDGKAEHVYTIKFKAPRVFTGIEYPGHIKTLTWNVDGSGHTSLIEEPVKASVWMTKKGLKRIVDVLLPDFTLPGIGTIGDILVENVTRTYNNNNGNPIYDYIGHVDDLSLAEGVIHAEVDLEGTSYVDGNVNFKIHVKWISNYDELHPQAIVAREPVEPVYIPIEVEFDGKTNTPEVPTGINDVTVDGADAPVEYFDLQGIRVSNPQAGQMVIRRQGTNVEKILVK